VGKNEQIFPKNDKWGGGKRAPPHQIEMEVVKVQLKSGAQMDDASKHIIGKKKGGWRGAV
jgi:hypothetical protein